MAELPVPSEQITIFFGMASSGIGMVYSVLCSLNYQTSSLTERSQIMPGTYQ
jgi:hypothetical protein